MKTTCWRSRPIWLRSNRSFISRWESVAAETRIAPTRAVASRIMSQITRTSVLPQVHKCQPIEWCRLGTKDRVALQAMLQVGRGDASQNSALVDRYTIAQFFGLHRIVRR